MIGIKDKAIDIYNLQEFHPALDDIPSIEGIRRDALEHFLRMGVPGNRSEEWKYLNLSFLKDRQFALPQAEYIPEAIPHSRLRIAEDSIIVVLENGRLNKQSSFISGLPAGLRILAFEDAVNDTEFISAYSNHAKFQNEPFVALNTALAVSGIVIFIDNNTHISRPVHIAMNTYATDESLMISNRVLVVAGKNSSCSITESYSSVNNDIPVFVNTVTETVMKEDSRIRYNKIQLESEGVYHINYHHVTQQENSHHHITTVTFGGSMVRNNLNLNLAGKHCESHLNGLYIAGGKQVMDNHTLVDHAMPESYSNEKYKGIMAGQSQAVFNGKIFVRQDAQKTNAYQSNKNILLSDDASVFAKPQLEIFADDVKCSHGATTGQLDEEAVFYLRSRGISNDHAIAMLNQAFAADIIDAVEPVALKESLSALLIEKLSK